MLSSVPERARSIALVTVLLASPALVNAACPPLDLEVSAVGSWSGQATRIPLRCVLAAIAHATGARVQGLIPDAEVSVDLRDVPTPVALARILGPRSYLLGFESERLVLISLLGSDGAPLAADGAASPRTVEARGDEPSLEELRHGLLDDPDVTARRHALDAVAAMRVLPAQLTAAVAQGDFDPRMRRRALELLAERSPRDPDAGAAAEILVRTDPDATVRAAALDLLRCRAGAPSGAGDSASRAGG